jgi:uncharacterized membrane protein YgdD (TMEM256/DUF423 family)
MMTQILIGLAGLMGAAGVILTAASAHGRPGVGLDAAGYLLVLHAAAVVAVGLAGAQNQIAPRLGAIAAAGFVLGGALFAGDVAMRAYLGTRLFPMAAPAGGTILILSWLVVSAAAIAALTARS